MYKYVHPGTIKQSYLTKSPPLEKRGLKGWKKRWCIFCRANGEDPWLNYYRTEQDAFCSLPIKRVNLKHCMMVEMDLNHRNYKNIFAIHLPERVYYFSAPSQIEMSEWADSLSSHLQLKDGTDTSTMPGTPPTNAARYMEHKPRAGTMPSEGLYSTSISPNLNHRPLPKAPNSPLPPIPNEHKHHHIDAPRSPAHSSGLRSSSPQLPVHAERRPSTTPPVPLHSPHLPLHSAKHVQMKPPVPPLRPVSPADVHSSGGVVNDIYIRPPAPPPKTVSSTSLDDIDCDDSDLVESPPTPPPRETPYSPPVLGIFFSEPEFLDPPPTLPPRILLASSPAVTPPPRTPPTASPMFTPPTLSPVVTPSRTSPTFSPVISPPPRSRISVETIPSFSFVPVDPPPLPPREMNSEHQLESPHQIYTAT